jgi:hypothetical protein
MLGAGNAQYRLGLLDASAPNVAQLEMAIVSYSEALKSNRKSEDAKHNLEIAKQKLEEVKRRRRQKATEDMAQSFMRRPQPAPSSAEEILQNAKKKQGKAQPYRRGVSTDW